MKVGDISQTLVQIQPALPSMSTDAANFLKRIRDQKRAQASSITSGLRG
jgi:hypothetical protein